MEKQMTSENNGIMPINLVNRNFSHEFLVEKTVEEIKKHKYINPLYDTGFKAFLSDEQALVNFLNGVFQTDEHNRIESVIIKNSEISFVFPAVKQFRLDIRATTSNGMCFNVEMQKARPDYFVDRILLQHGAFLLQSKYEWDKLNFGETPSSISKEERAKREIHRYEIPPTYAIWICDFPLGKQTSYRGDWAVRDERGLTLSEKIKYITYDLTKFMKPIEEIRTVEDRWLYLLKHAGTAENLPDFDDDVIAKAIRRLLVNKASDNLIKEQASDMVFTEEQLDRIALADVRARAIVRAEGIAEGEVKGADRRNIEMALDMLADNEPIEKIVKYSHLPEEKVIELRDSRA